MPKVNVEEYNFFICPECDTEGANRLSPDEFKKHLAEVHGIKAKEGNRQMMMHADGSNWFLWIYEWKIEGKSFMQHIRQARHHKFDF